MLRAILMMLNYSLAFASYALAPTSEEVDTLKDEALVQMAYSNSSYDNVGELYNYRKNHCTHMTLKLKLGSAVYIGDKVCLCAAHCELSPPSKFSLEPVTQYYEVAFETKDRERTHYKVKKFIPYPQYKKNNNYDLAVLILEDHVKELNGLRISEEFSTEEAYDDRTHLLTYVGYGGHFSDDGYFYMTSHKRRATRAYTQFCALTSNALGIYSTPHGQYNQSKASRPLIPYEARTRQGMSGGAAINCNDELVGIIFGLMIPSSWQKTLYSIGAMAINIIPSFIDTCCCPMPMLNRFPENFGFGTRIKSIPVAPFKGWIKAMKNQHSEIYIDDI